MDNLNQVKKDKHEEDTNVFLNETKSDKEESMINSASVEAGQNEGKKITREEPDDNTESATNTETFADVVLQNDAKQDNADTQDTSDKEIDGAGPSSNSDKENKNDTTDEQPVSIFPVDFSMYTTDLQQQSVIDFGIGEINYSTKEIADELCITTQTVRNYADYFAEFLSEERGINGQRFFTAEDYELFKQIIDLKNRKRYTKQEIKLLLEGTGYKRQQTPKQSILSPATGNTNTAHDENDAALMVQKEAVTALVEQIQGKLTHGLEQMQNNILQKFEDNVCETTRMRETISEQQELIKKQAEEIVKLRSSVGNIGHDTRVTIEKIDNLSEETKNVAALNDDIKKDIIETINNKQDNTENIKKAVSSLETNIKQNTDNTVGVLKEQLSKQSQQINNVSQNIASIKQNIGKDKQNEANASQITEKISNQIKDEQKRIEKLIEEHTKANKVEIQKLGEYIESLKIVENSAQTGGEHTNEEFEELSAKYEKAYSLIQFLQGKNGELVKKNNELLNELNTLRDKVNAQDSKIKDLNGKITAILQLKTQQSQQSAKNTQISDKNNTVNGTGSAPVKQPLPTPKQQPLNQKKTEPADNDLLGLLKEDRPSKR